MREVINFNKNWLYTPNDNQLAKNIDFNDDCFEKVCVPHANTILKKHKGEEGYSFLNEIERYRFVSWYRRHFIIDKKYVGKKIFVEFEAVATVAEVYVNGNFVTTHKGAYTPFTADITDFVKIGEDNVISVRVDSTKHTDIPPEGDKVDYCIFGGIVRNVNMIITDKAYIKDVFITSEITADEAIIQTKADLSEGEKFTVKVFDIDGNLVSEGGEITKISSPHLWGINDPYLYTMKVETDTDCYKTRIGLRSFEFVNSGIKLNGEVIKIMGINRHEQWPWIGRAIPDKLQVRDADMIKETGFNAVRCSHYPQSPAFLDRCDEIGLIVFEEAPGWQHIGDDSWREIYKENIREMIHRDKNHPSIFSWGVRVNESNDCDELYEETNKLSHELDPTRPTHGTRRRDTYENGTNLLEDIYTAHYIYPEDPDYKPFIITEHSWDSWMNGYGFGWATDEQALAYTRDFADKVNYYFGNPNCAGGFAWSMFDYDNEVNYTKSDNVFYSGMYDIFRLPKMAANLYISQKDPSLHGANIYIANYWDDDSKPLQVNTVSGDVAQGAESKAEAVEGDTFCITVMSNCEKVELFINGKKVDKEPVRQYTNIPHPFFVFEDVVYEEGEVVAIGYIKGEKVAEHTRKTPLSPDRIILTPDYDTLICDGTDMTQVSVHLVDKNGTVLHTNTDEITINVTGAGDFIGEEKIRLEGGKCAFIIKSRYLEKGDVVCTVNGNGVKEGRCVIKVTE